MQCEYSTGRSWKMCFLEKLLNSGEEKEENNFNVIITNEYDKL